MNAISSFFLTKQLSKGWVGDAVVEAQSIDNVEGDSTV